MRRQNEGEVRGKRKGNPGRYDESGWYQVLTQQLYSTAVNWSTDKTENSTKAPLLHSRNHLILDTTAVGVFQRSKNVENLRVWRASKHSRITVVTQANTKKQRNIQTPTVNNRRAAKEVVAARSECANEYIRTSTTTYWEETIVNKRNILMTRLNKIGTS